jgi:hypothetical protein
MKVILRHAGIGLYYAGRKHWVGAPEAALDLKTIERAAEVSREEAFQNMEIYINYDDPRCDLVLPVARKKEVAGAPPAAAA